MLCQSDPVVRPMPNPLEPPLPLQRRGQGRAETLAVRAVEPAPLYLFHDLGQTHGLPGLAPDLLGGVADRALVQAGSVGPSGFFARFEAGGA